MGIDFGSDGASNPSCSVSWDRDVLRAAVARGSAQAGTVKKQRTQRVQLEGRRSNCSLSPLKKMPELGKQSSALTKDACLSNVSAALVISFWPRDADLNEHNNTMGLRGVDRLMVGTPGLKVAPLTISSRG